MSCCGARVIGVMMMVMSHTSGEHGCRKAGENGDLSALQIVASMRFCIQNINFKVIAGCGFTNKQLLCLRFFKHRKIAFSLLTKIKIIIAAD